MEIRNRIEKGMQFPDINQDYLPLLADIYNEDYGHPNAVRGHKENGTSQCFACTECSMRKICPRLFPMETFRFTGRLRSTSQ